MWTIVLSVVAAWCLLSVPLALVVGRFIAGPSRHRGHRSPARPTVGRGTPTAA